MKINKSYFEFTNKQRNGIFLLVAITVALQCLYMFVDFSEDEIYIDQNELQDFRNEIDALRLVELENRKPKIYPFNPNYITDFKGYTLGMSNEEIDRLHQYRAANKWVNSVKDFQTVTKISDSVLAKISPYFKFPEWVTRPKPKKRSYNNAYPNNNTPKSYAQKIDLNKATAPQLQNVYGVGEKLSNRIIKARNKYSGGFIADVELTEVWGLSAEVIKRINNDFTVKTPRPIQKFNINTATRDELVTIQYIDYEIAKHIIETRTLKEGFKTLEELVKVEDFPVKKIEIIKLYLYL